MRVLKVACFRKGMGTVARAGEKNLKDETDYLVVGCGASAMAFTDVMLKETNATITILDRRHAPGGHWNDVYPFVKLQRYFQIAIFILSKTIHMVI